MLHHPFALCNRKLFWVREPRKNGAIYEFAGEGIGIACASEEERERGREEWCVEKCSTADFSDLDDLRNCYDMGEVDLRSRIMAKSAHKMGQDRSIIIFNFLWVLAD